MIEAKGPGFAKMLRDPLFDETILPADWKKQADSQLKAANGRPIEWYFAEPEAAERARELFHEWKFDDRICVIVEPALVN